MAELSIEVKLFIPETPEASPSAKYLVVARRTFKTRISTLAVEVLVCGQLGTVTRVVYQLLLRTRCCDLYRFAFHTRLSSI